MKKLNILLLLFAAFASACSDMNDLHDAYLRNGEIIYVGRVDSLFSFAGNERVLLRYWITDPRAKNLHIFWNQKRDSTVVQVPAHDPANPIEVMVENIAEGDHTFLIYSYNGKGHRSIVYESLVSVYGQRYQASLANRLIKSIDVDDDNDLVIEWEGSVSPDETGVSFSFTDKDNVARSLFAATETLNRPLEIDNIDITKPVRYQTLFLPQAEAIDTFRTEQTPIVIKKRINAALNKSVTSSDDLSADYTGRNAVDGAITNASRWVSDAGNGAHWLEVDLGQPYAVDGFKTYIGSGGNYNYPVAQFEFQAYVDGQWSAIVSVTGNSDARYGRDFDSVTTDKVRYYVPAYSGNQIRMYELEVYSTIVY
jgi:hypothetical protein